MQELDYTKITKRMKEVRKEANLTQEQVANALNCTPAYISNVENNRVNLNLRLLNYYSKLCKVPMECFLESDCTDSSVGFSCQFLKETDTTNEEKLVNAELSQLLLSFTIPERKKIIEILKIWKTL